MEMLLPSLTGQRLMAMFDMLLDHFGHQHWWPGDSAFEMMVGAILTQNTNWKNVEKAIENLKFDNILSVKAIQTISVQDLAEKIRPAGYFNIKAGRLKNLINFIWQRHRGDLSHLLDQKTHILREQLLSVKGIGPETADSIILYAAQRPVFVIDTYTYRILNRHEMVDNMVSYDDLQELFMYHLPEDATLFNEFHALIVKTGKEYCRKKPRCNVCPLEKW
jgi:endonuclease-3 related protein